MITISGSSRIFLLNTHLLVPDPQSARPRLDYPVPTHSRATLLTHAEAVLRLPIRPSSSGQILVVILCIAIIAIVSAWAGATLFTVTRRLPRYSE
jgi:hypothetical protein